MRIRVIGSGIRPIQHLTLAAVKHLKETKKVLFFPTVKGELEEFFNLIQVQSYESLSDLYKNGEKDVENYQRIVSKIINDVKKLGDIVFLLPGNPRLGVTTLKWLEEHPECENISIQVVEGISSLDTMMNDLHKDPLENGTIVIDANRLLMFNYSLDPKFDYYIYHVCSVGTQKTYYHSPATENSIHILRDYLLQVFPASHICTFICSPVMNNQSAIIHQCKLSELEKMLPHISFGTTLYIPGIELK